MFEDLPPETIALKAILADLHDDLEGRVERFRLLIAVDYDFGGGGSLMLSGGSPAQMAYSEVRHAFICGNFLSVILLAQCLAENLLAAQLGIEAVSAEIHGREPVETSDRPAFHQTLARGRRVGLLDEADERDFKKLARLRNAIAHFRSLDDPMHLDRRAIEACTHPAYVCEEDARGAVILLMRLLGKPAFRPSKPLNP